jgi:pyruvate kinase
MIKTKIIVTYGPSISSMDTLKKVLKYADIVRINFSHEKKEDGAITAETIKRLAYGMQKDIAILADLPGPKVRISALDAPILVKKGEVIIFSSTPAKGAIQVQHENFHKDARVGAYIDIGDGDAKFRINGINGTKVVTRAVADGKMSSRKGISIIGADMSISAPTSADLDLARFVLKNDFDLIGMSFVKSGADIVKMRKACGEAPIVAKIERKVAVRNINEIAREADGVMVARGDLAMGVSLEHIPEAQKKIISAARSLGKPAILATQLLTSMINNLSPTRAEVNDIANGVAQGADCLMLSDETAVGKHPVEAVRFLSKAAKVAEGIPTVWNREYPKVTSINGGIAFAASNLADEYKTDCIFIPTQTGFTAKMISRLRPDTDLIALVPNEKVRKRLCLYYGVRSMVIERYGTIDRMFDEVKEIAKKNGIKRYIVVSGSPHIPGSTDTLKYIGSDD